jgi:hypothetical protein
MVMAHVTPDDIKASVAVVVTLLINESLLLLSQVKGSNHTSTIVD